MTTTGVWALNTLAKGERNVPYIELLVYGREFTGDERRRLFAEVADVTTRTLEVTLSQVRIGILELSEEAGFDGSREASEYPEH